jgi:pyruvate/2-oxoglutarate dehydrogenase complex dihydrolipoamide dehydrogenase (E3) component
MPLPWLFLVKHNWEAMTEAIQNHISSLNWGYRLSLREKGVAYVNSYGEFVEPHKIKVMSECLVLFVAFPYYCLNLP